MESPLESSEYSGDPQPVSRERLYNLLWAEPATKVAARYGVSGSFLARVCDRLRVPRPKAGYWAQHAVGKAPPMPPLPDPEPGDELSWTPSGQSRTNAERKKRLPRRVPSAAPTTRRSNEQSANKPSTDAQTITRGEQAKTPSIHPLVQGLIELIKKGRVTSEGFYKPNKKLLPDITTSECQLESAVNLANRLYKLLEKRGHHVRLANASDQFHRVKIDPYPPSNRTVYRNALWVPQRPTVVYVNDLPIGLTIFETCTEVEMQYVNGKYIPAAQVSKSTRLALGNRTWTTTEMQASGIFCLTAYTPQSGTSWTHEWRGKPGELGRQLEEVLDALSGHLPDMRSAIEQANIEAEQREREWQELRRKWREEEHQKRRIAALESSKKELAQIIEEWDEQKRITSFFEGALHKAGQQSPEQRVEIERRIVAARELVGDLDPLARLLKWKSPSEIYPPFPKASWDE